MKHTKLFGVADYCSAIETVISLALHHIRIFDRDLDNLGFNSPERQRMLHEFLLANPENRLEIVAMDLEYLQKRCPRMMMLLERFNHNMTVRQSGSTVGSRPFIVADGENYAQRFHVDDARGVLGEEDPHEARVLVDQFEEISAAASPPISPTLSGL